MFGSKTTAESVTNGVDLTGTVAIVTGCTSGIGYETMRVLALRGAHVIGTGRTTEKAERACSAVSGYTTPVALELSDFRSVRACADAVNQQVNAIDILICNAGTMASATLELVGHVERTFVNNHLGHFLFVSRLRHRVTAAPTGRVVVVSSEVAYRRWPGRIDFDSLRGAGPYSYMRAYGQSKLANALFSRELARRWRGTPATSNAVSPGFVRTNIENRAPTVLRRLMKLFGPLIAKTPAQGAATTCYVATAPQLDGVSGEFFENCRRCVFGARHPLSDDALAARLWRVSEELTGTAWS